MKTRENKGAVTMSGKPITLLGDQLEPGDKAPDFTAVDRNFKPVKLSDFKGKTVLISVVQSLDTSVCSTQTKRFNAEIGALPPNAAAMTISMDLPFAQKRFCESEKVDRMMTLSDHVWREFGLRYGVLVKDMGLLARSIFVVGSDGKIAHKQLGPELSKEPDYDAALEAARRAAKG